MAEVSLTSINTISKDLQTLTLTGVVRIDREPLGSGSYGKVFAVKHGGKTCAAKEIHSIFETVSIEEKRAVRDNFLKECHQCSTLRHPNIVQFIGVYYPDPQKLPVMVMELMDTSLTEFVKTPNINMKLKISILHDISQSLSFLHDRTSPIIHRDLSPNNILLSRNSVAKISDLGVAKVVKAGTKNTQTKAPGTTDFMPPEALADHPKYSTGLDVFSYGGIILHTVNQEWPTPISSVKYDHKMKPIKVLTEVERRQKYLDMMTAEAEVLKSLVVRCLDNDPANRPTSADLLKTLNQLEKQQGYEVIDNPNWNKPEMSHARAPFMLMYAILLENRHGYKETGLLKDFTKWTVGKPYTEKMVLAGNLLQILSDDEVASLAQHFQAPPNYKVLGESGVRLHCIEAWVHRLTTKQKDLLFAVKSTHDRVASYQNLEWVEQLQVGSKVYVRVHNVYEPVRATVHYIGKLLGENGIRFGVELLSWIARGKGSTDGIFQNIRHFNCEKDCGLFISMEKLTKEPPPTHVVIPFKKGDKVTTFDVKGKPVRGTVAWIGKNKEAMPNGSYIIGVYTDEFIVDINNHFPVRIANMEYMINYSVHRTRLFLPADCFIAGSVDSTSTNHRHGHGYNTRHADSNQSFNTSAKAAGKNSGLGSQERDMFGEADRIHRREAAQKWKEQDDLERVQKAESDERRHRQMQAKEVLKIGNTIDLDDIILDPEKQKEILADLKKLKKNVIGDANEASGMPPHHDQSHGNVGSSSDHYTPNNGNSSHHEPSNLPPVQEARNFNQTDQQQQQRQQQSSSSTRPSQMQEDWQKQQQEQQLQQQWEWQQQQWQQQQWKQQQQQWQQQQQQQQWQQQQQQWQQQQQQQWHQQQQHQQFLQQKHWQQPQPNHAYVAPFDCPAQAQQQQWDQREQQHDKQPIGMDNILRAEHAIPGPIANQRIPENSTGGFQRQKLHVYEEVPGEPTEPPQPKYNWSKGSMVEIGDPDSPRYGVIKWIGYLPGSSNKTAGVEMEETIFGGGDGAFDGFKYFKCQTGHGMFVRLETLRPDIRFTVSESLKAAKPNPFIRSCNIYEPSTATGHLVQAPEELNIFKHIGIKGIQGQQNSCYLDATLYGMFAFSNAFDALFLERKHVDDFEFKVKNTLEQKIVNPLRKVHAVVQDSILALQRELATLLKMKGITSDEKDPEEFLNLLFKHVLHVEPFLHINRPYGTDKEFFIQLFVVPDENFPMPDTHWLLHKMFKEDKITFKEYPQRLLLQVPHHGKQFKAFERVKPTLKLDVSVLCEGYAGPCFVCDKPGETICTDCSQLDYLKKSDITPYFCAGCSAIWHNHPQRQSHKPVARSGTPDTHPLELLSVLCIETSHYVCFTRITGSGKDQWVFFDSMATRTDDEYNIPRVTNCTDEINEWVYGDKDISKLPSKELPELVRRYVGDPYLCIYTEFGGNLY